MTDEKALRAMRKTMVCKLLLPLALIGILLFLLVYRFPVSISTTSYDPETDSLPHTLTRQIEKMEAKSDQAVEGYQLQYGDLITVTCRSALRGTVTEYYLPCLTAKVCALGSAGSSEWVFSFRLLSSERAPSLHITGGTATFSAMENTCLGFSDGYCGTNHFSSSNENDSYVPLVFSRNLKDIVWLYSTVGTLNSNLAHNQPVTGSLTWSIQYSAGITTLSEEYISQFDYVVNQKF